MSLTFVAAASNTDAFTGGSFDTTTVSKPAGVAVGDLLLCFIGSRGGNTPTPPAGWTLVLHPSGQYEWCWKRIADAADVAANSYTWNTLRQTNGYAITMVAYRGQDTSTPLGVSGAGTDTFSSPLYLVATDSVTPTVPGSLLVAYFDLSYAYDGSVMPSGMTNRIAGSNGGSFELWDQAVAPGTTGTRTRSTGAGGLHGAMAVIVQPQNSAPTAPTLISPASGATLDRTITQRLAWTHNDPDVGDPQSAFSLRYRISGSWTYITGTTPNGYVDVAGGTFPAGNYEWQVATTDALGLTGPYSASGFFTAATPPTAPTITAPTSGATIGLSTATFTWSYPTETDYQVRKVADLAGSPDASTVYYDSGTVTDATTRSVIVAFPVNNRYEHLQVRVKDSGLWSTWSSIRVHIAYTQPATPTLAVTPSNATGSVTLAVTNPTPTGSQPTVTSWDVFRRVGASGTMERIATGVTGAWTDWTPASGVDYRYMVRAVGTTGTTADSTWSA